MTQCERILKYMDDFGSISNREAFNDLGVGRLASRIHDLRRMGYNIVSETVQGKNRYDENVYYSKYSRAV